MSYSGPIPQLGLGTFGRTGDAGVAALLKAIEIGYRHIDTAQTYDTERQVGEAMRRSGLPRGAFFITTKVADTRLERSSCQRRAHLDDRRRPGDLLLIHWPSYRDEVPFEDYMLALPRRKPGARPADRFQFSDRAHGRPGSARQRRHRHQPGRDPSYPQAPTRDYAKAQGLPLTPTSRSPRVKSKAIQC